ncbi:MAG: hypothetical protein LKG27_00800 [Clostridiaceae bacterium]|jgi:hypothetical protein|nr:hypothetical protein [Clostridiaceae bacterium]
MENTIIDTNYSFTEDSSLSVPFWKDFWDEKGICGASTSDPDKESEVLEQYHKILWGNRVLPNGKIIVLEESLFKGGLDWADILQTKTADDGTLYYTVNAATKATSSKQNYKVLDPKLASDSNWLKYALENGIVTLKKTQLDCSAETSGSVAELTSEKITWKNIIYTSASDMKEIEDTAGQAEAKAKYEKDTSEIEAKDKEYDTKLKNLDTIHSALQTEYDSVKGVITKNVERSFKIFS